MSIITFWNNTREQCGCTSTSLAVATHLAIEHNVRILLISTSLNDTLMRDAFWQEKKKKTSGLFGPNTSSIEQNGIEGLDRVIRSNKVSSDIITDYTKVVLRDRLELLLSYTGSPAQYESIREKFSQIILFAEKSYDFVFVDLDNKLPMAIQEDILKKTDLIVALISQRLKEIEKIIVQREKADLINENNSILVIGKYMSETKYNNKNISRNVLKQKQLINIIPYNNKFFEALQEGKLIDLFLNFLRLKDTNDVNYQFMNELRRLTQDINNKLTKIPKTNRR